ncbi:putative lysine-specific demethylase 4A, partial [Frankliniella fusca]
MSEGVRHPSSVEHGTTVFTVCDEDLCKFILLIDSIEKEGYSGDQNIYKLRLDQTSRSEGTKPKELVALLSPYIKEHCVLQELRKYKLCKDSYGYKRISPGECHLVNNFAKLISDTLTTSQSPSSVVEHFFKMLESFPVEVTPERCHAALIYNKEELVENAAQLRDDYQKLISSLQEGQSSSVEEEKPIFEKCMCVDCFSFSDEETGSESESEVSTTNIHEEKKREKKSISDKTCLQAMKNYPRYATGIQLDKEKDEVAMISKCFSMSAIKSVLNLLPHNYHGLQIPYFYVGEEHSVFAAHIEDAALYSANYLHLGNPKVWITISPEFCDKLRSSIQFLQMELAHTSCVNSLSHKFFFFTIKFPNNNSIPFHITVQYEGEMVVLRPNTVHYGFNCGPNIAEAVNFGTISWIPEGVKAQKWRCRCFEDALIHLDMTCLAAAFYPNLLDSLYESSIDYIHKKGTEIVESSVNDVQKEDSKIVAQDCLAVDTEDVHEKDKLKRKRPLKTYKCPHLGCSISYRYNKCKLLNHVRTEHSNDLEDL